MSLIDDMLNGGIDRDLDGDIDKRDRDIMFAEEAIAKEKERRETTYEYDYDDENDDFDDDFDDENDYDDLAESYSSYRYSMTVPTPSKKETTATPIYNGQKPAKDDKIIIEWENMPAEIAKKAKKAYSVYLLCLTVFLLGFVIALILPAVFYDDIDDLSPFFSGGLIVGFIGFILTGWSSCKSFEMTKYYTHIEDKNGRKKYRSEYEANKKSASKTDILQKK